jgi:hypothetical protein
MLHQTTSRLVSAGLDRTAGTLLASSTSSGTGVGDATMRKYSVPPPRFLIGHVFDPPPTGPGSRRSPAGTGFCQSPPGR